MQFNDAKRGSEDFLTPTKLLFEIPRASILTHPISDTLCDLYLECDLRVRCKQYRGGQK